VFGSPKNRDRTGLIDEEALACAVPFFRKLGDIAGEHGVVVCLEPNPASYGANFMTSSFETAHVVRAVDHSAIRMQFDTGALTINGESAEAVLKDCAHLIGHVHASEPNLVPLGDYTIHHDSFYEGIKRYLPHHLVSIEMVATKKEPHLTAMERALVCATKYYRPITGVLE
jgi:sugar phosphate isomerase/epimerase